MFIQACQLLDQVRSAFQYREGVPVADLSKRVRRALKTEEGELHYEFILDQTEVVSNPGDNPLSINAMKRQMHTMLGVRGSATVTSRGFGTGVTIDIPGGVSPQVRQMIDDMKQSMARMLAPLPDEPVGKGARWQATTPIATPAMKFTQIATYTLSEIQGDTVKLDVQIEQSAPPQESRPSGAAPGVTVMLESFSTSGSGTVELQMTNVVPTSKLNMTTTNVVVSDQRVKTTMQIWAMIDPLP